MPVRVGPLDLAALDQLQVDALVVFVAEDERPLAGLAGLLDWRLAGALSRLVESGALSGGEKEALLTVTGGRLAAPRLFAFGLGPQAKATPERFGEVATRAAAAMEKAKVRNVAVGLPELPRPTQSARLLAEAFARLPDALVLGELQELALALPEAAKRS